MAQRYIVINKHAPEDCEPMEAALINLPAHLVGREFICTCPHGEHGFYMFLEGSSADEVIAGLPTPFQPGTRALAIESFHLRSSQA